MSFVKQFLGKSEPTKEDLDDFIRRKIEEALHLDYKHIKAIEDPSKLAIHISSFANADGGLIILGVDQDVLKEKGKIIKIFPKEITWGNLSYSKETLEQQLLQRINPRISDLAIFPIRNEKKEVVFLIDIPKSNFAPHMAPDHRYHRRMNFGSQLMEYYEVQNLFRINWTMKEKLVEKIYEPLSIELEKCLKQLENYELFLSSYEFTQVLSNTYYARQIPLELSKQIAQFIQKLEDLNRKLSYTRINLKRIILKNIFEYIKLTQPKDYERIEPRFLLILEHGQGGINIFDLFKLLLNNQTIKSYVNSLYQDRCLVITIEYENSYQINLDDFNDIIWKKCLNEVTVDSEINQMKEVRTSLKLETENLIDVIVKY